MPNTVQNAIAVANGITPPINTGAPGNTGGTNGQRNAPTALSTAVAGGFPMPVPSPAIPGLPATGPEPFRVPVSNGATHFTLNSSEGKRRLSIAGKALFIAALNNTDEGVQPVGALGAWEIFFDDYGAKINFDPSSQYDQINMLSVSQPKLFISGFPFNNVTFKPLTASGAIRVVLFTEPVYIAFTP